MKGHNYHYCVVSYPKCGRTWLRQMDKEYAALTCGKETKSLYTHLNYGIGGGGEFPRIAYLRDHPNTPKFMLTRDPADTLVSYYHDDMVRGDEKKMEGVVGDIDAYCKKHLPTLMEFYNAASEFDYIYTLGYEDMLEDTIGTLLPMFKIIYKETLNLEALETAIETCKFETLAKLERAGKVDMRVSKNYQNKGFFKTRKGKAGSAVEELKPETLEWIQEQLAHDAIID